MAATNLCWENLRPTQASSSATDETRQSWSSSFRRIKLIVWTESHLKPRRSDWAHLRHRHSAVDENIPIRIISTVGSLHTGDAPPLGRVQLTCRFNPAFHLRTFFGPVVASAAMCCSWAPPLCVSTRHTVSSNSTILLDDTMRTQGQERSSSSWVVAVVCHSDPTLKARHSFSRRSPSALPKGGAQQTSFNVLSLGCGGRWPDFI